jgi:predicted permease
MGTVFTQVMTLFVFVSIGYVLGKSRICDLSHTKVLSKLLVYVFLPCNVFKTFSGNFTFSYIAGNYTLVIAGTVVLFCVLIFAYFVAKLFAREKYQRYLYEYSVIIPNFGYMGYALALDLFGEAGQINFMTFAIPFSIYIYSIGINILTKKAFKPKNLLQPVLIAMVLGIVVGLTNLRLPEILTGTVYKAAQCMAPLSMIMTGLVTAERPLLNILKNKRVYPMLVLRLILMPLVVGGILQLFFAPAVVQAAVLFYALPCGINTVVFPKMVDENCEVGISLALTSAALSCITMPLILQLFS